MKDNISNHQFDPFFILGMGLLRKNMERKLVFPQLSKKRSETVRNTQVARNDPEAACKELKSTFKHSPSSWVLQSNQQF